MAIRSESLEALKAAFSKLRVAMGYIHCYGKPAGKDLDAFDRGLVKNIDDASEISDRLGQLLLDAQIDSQLHDVEVMLEARRQDKRTKELQAFYLLWDWINNELETRTGSGVVELVESVILNRVLAQVIMRIKELEKVTE